jgi:hypothetical protein
MIARLALTSMAVAVSIGSFGAAASAADLSVRAEHRLKRSDLICVAGSRYFAPVWCDTFHGYYQWRNGRTFIAHPLR